MNLLLISSGNYPLMDKLEKWIESYSINTSITMLLKVLIALAVIALIEFIADYLTKKGMPFRDAYKLTGCMVSDR